MTWIFTPSRKSDRFQTGTLIDLPEIRNDEIQVWRIDLSSPHVSPKNLVQCLAEDERERALAFRFARDRERFARTRAALRHILGSALDSDPASLRFTIGPYGKPHIAGCGLRFNVSHSADLGLVAVAWDRELGVDIEATREMEDATSIARRFFAADEAQQIADMTDPAKIEQAFFECWTRKEAFVKATGEGLSRALDSFHVTFFPSPLAQLRVDSDEPQRWTLVKLEPGPGYRAALVFELLADGVVPQIAELQWQPPRHDRTSFSST